MADEIEANEAAATQPKRPRLSAEDTSAIWWLLRWIGLPLLLVIAVFYAEPLFHRDRVEVVERVTHQEVHPYPFPAGANTTTLAPPALPRNVPEPVAPDGAAPLNPQLTNDDIVANPLAQPQPRYPQRALNAEKEGTVRLRLTIAPDGSVVGAVVIAAEPSGWFETAAAAAVKQWRYRPSGRTLQTEAEIEFKLK